MKIEIKENDVRTFRTLQGNGYIGIHVWSCLKKISADKRHQFLKNNQNDITTTTTTTTTRTT